jgi:hypothetical protein
MGMNDVPIGACGGFENLTVSSSSVSFDAANYSENAAVAGYAKGIVETNSIRWRCDGGSVSTTVGTLAIAGSTIELNHPADIARFRAIAAAADGALQIAFWRHDPRG